MYENHAPPSPEDCPAQLKRAAEYIQAHYAEVLTLEKLASVACYSKYHFHRLFREHFGETVNDHIRRVRLEQAVHRLAADADASIAAVAEACGFSSPQNFARSFKFHFGSSPKSVRRKSVQQIIKSAAGSSEPNVGNAPLDVEIKILAPQRVAYIRHVGAYRSASNMQAVYRLTKWAVAKRITERSLLPIAAAWNDPATTPDHECVCDMCLMVSGDIEGEGEINIQYLPGGQFAVLHAEVGWEALTALRNRFFYNWLPANGFRRDDRPYYFIYYNNPMNLRKKAILDICLPVQPA